MSDSEDLRRLYRQLPEEEPSRELDANVRAAVMATLQSADQDDRGTGQRRWRQWQRWRVPLATAATVVLAVSLMLEQMPPPSSKPTDTYKSTNGAVEDPGPEGRSTAAADIIADEYSRHQEPPAAPRRAERLPDLSALPPPPPAPIEAPAFVPPTAAIVASPAPPPAAAMAAPAMDLSATPLQQWSLESVGLPAAEFCVRLSALWPAGETAPDCPVTDGAHEWPSPVAVRWAVADGTVRSVELLSP